MGAASIVINRVSTQLRDARLKRSNRNRERAKRCSARGYAALHRAMYPGLQVSDLGLAVEGPQRGFQQLGAKPGLSDGADRGAFGLVPNDVEAIVGDGPRYLQQPPRRRERAVFSGIGGELVKDQGEAHRQFGGQK